MVSAGNLLDDLYNQAQSISTQQSQIAQRAQIESNAFFAKINEVISSENVKNYIKENGVYNLLVFKDPCTSGSRGGGSVRAQQIEPRESMDYLAFEKLHKDICKELQPYHNEDTERKGCLTGHLYHIVDCRQECTLNSQGIPSYSKPRTHENCMTATSQELYIAEKMYLDNSVNTDAEMNKFLKHWNDYLVRVVAKTLLTGPVVLRFRFNEYVEGKKVDPSVNLEYYKFQDKLTMVQVSDLIAKLKTLMKSEPNCYYTDFHYTSMDDHGGSKELIYVDSKKADKKESPSVIADFLIVPKGASREGVKMYEAAKQKDMWIVRG